MNMVVVILWRLTMLTGGTETVTMETEFHYVHSLPAPSLLCGLGICPLNSLRAIPSNILETEVQNRREDLLHFYLISSNSRYRMAEIDRFSGVVTPPLSENGDADRCPISTRTAEQVNNDSAASSPFPPSPPSSIRVRRDRSSSQKEAIRSKQFTTRVQRSDSTASNNPLGRQKSKGFRHQINSLPADHGLKAIEPPHEQALTKMAFAEQQKWITVQQKTFTKWYGLEGL
jgi:hypothetical protein